MRDFVKTAHTCCDVQKCSNSYEHDQTIHKGVFQVKLNLGGEDLSRHLRGRCGSVRRGIGIGSVHLLLQRGTTTLSSQNHRKRERDLELVEEEFF